MEKSRNCIIRFLWEPCDKIYMMTPTTGQSVAAGMVVSSIRRNPWCHTMSYRRCQIQEHYTTSFLLC